MKIAKTRSRGDTTTPLDYREFVERVYASRHEVYRVSAVGFDKTVWSVYISPESFASVLTDLAPRLTTAVHPDQDGNDTVFGFPLRTDRDLENHRIVWRAEVEA